MRGDESVYTGVRTAGAETEAECSGSSFPSGILGHG